jgi:SAM-dependent methyltransferase
MFLEIRESFTSLEDWQAWADALPQLRSAEYIEEIVRSVSVTGFIDPCFGVIPAQDVTPSTENFREGLQAKGCTSRYRAISALVMEAVLANGWCSTIYLAEHATDFAEVMGGRFPHVVKGENIPNPVIRMRMPHIRHEDPLALSFPDHSFDIYISPDVMMYAPSMDGFLREARRVLRRTGQLLATFPFRYGEPDTELRAEVIKGEIIHHLPPLFHRDALSGSRSRLVFFIPGWDILDAAHAAGFQSAEIVVLSSRTHAIVGSEIAGVFVLKATA